MHKANSFLSLLFFCLGLSYLGNLSAKDSKGHIFNDFLNIANSPTSECIESKNPYGVALVQEQQERGPYNRHQNLLKSSHKIKYSYSLRDRGIYINKSGGVIIDAKFLKGVQMQKGAITCIVCHKKINLKRTYTHFKKTKHRFFIKMRLA